MGLRDSASLRFEQDFSYDSASRLSVSTLDSGQGTVDSATYSYVANSPLVNQITFKQNGNTRMTTTKSYDNLNRLTQISTLDVGLRTLDSHAYAYNNANQRTRNTQVDGSYWLYNYDSLGQVTSGKKYWSDGTPVAGQQFEYNFDNIGNRTSTKAGGDANGANLRQASYTPNNLNQITSRDVPGYIDIMGVSFATNTVTVNNQTAYRKVEYFRKELGVDNSSMALWTNITVAATGQGSVSGNKYVPKTPEQFLYDADGNLTNDGRFTYIWDAENRLVQMTVNTNVGPQYQLTFAYDPKGRRIQKVVATNGVAISTNKFLYDGWNLIAEVAPNNSLIRSYVWGTDLSGSMQGAGGVGGLLEMSYYGNSTTNCFPAFDGNGNVMALINTADGTTVANYDYDPFLGIIRATGPMAFANMMLGSTKYYDDETDTIMYPRRPYSPSKGRFLTHDPIGENGGLNLYEFVGNNPISSFDPLGLSCQKCGVKSLRAIDDGWVVKPTWIAFRFHVTAKLRTDSPYQASCCKVVQWRQDTTTWNGQLVSADGNQPTDGELHIDSNPYIPGDDVTNPGSQIGSPSGDTITYTDTPTRGGNPGDILGGDLRFRIVVYDSCNNYKVVARTGFKVWWQGTWPNINYGNN